MTRAWLLGALPLGGCFIVSDSRWNAYGTDTADSATVAATWTETRTFTCQGGSTIQGDFAGEAVATPPGCDGCFVVYAVAPKGVLGACPEWNSSATPWVTFGLSGDRAATKWSLYAIDPSSGSFVDLGAVAPEAKGATYGFSYARTFAGTTSDPVWSSIVQVVLP